MRRRVPTGLRSTRSCRDSHAAPVSGNQALLQYGDLRIEPVGVDPIPFLNVERPLDAHGTITVDPLVYGALTNTDTFAEFGLSHPGFFQVLADRVHVLASIFNDGKY
jgi:hypothetical protein